MEAADSDSSVPTPPPPPPDSSLVLSLRHAGVKIKTSLDAKWQAKTVQQSVVVPFVRAFNKKRPDEPISESALLGALVDEKLWIDATQPVAKAVPAGAGAVELFFGSKEQLMARQCRVSCGEVSLKIDIESKWLRRPFAAAVVVPFTLAYNKKLVPSPLRPEDFAGGDVDGDAFDASEASKPTAMLVPIGAKQIELRFGGADGGSASASARDAGPQLSDAERLKAFWSKVSSSVEKAASATHLQWSNMRLAPSDAAPMASALRAATLLRCEGSYGDGLGNLRVLNLESNQLRCEGLEALMPALDEDSVMVSLIELYLMNNRIGDRGVEALVSDKGGKLPRLKILQLQENAIGPLGMQTLARAFERGWYVRHLNVLDNKCQLTSEMEELKEAVKLKFVELRAPQIQSAKDAMKNKA